MSTLPPMKRGDTPKWEIAVLDEDGAPLNLSGWTIRMTAKRSVTDTDAEAVFQLSTVDGTITLINAAGGIAQAQPLRSSTNTLTEDLTVSWDVQIARDVPTEETYTVDSGTLLIARDITRTAP